VLGAVLLALGPALGPAYYALDLPQRFEALLGLVGTLAAAVGGITLAVWLVFASGFSPRLRLTVGALLLTALAALGASIDGFDVTGDLGFRPRFRWQTRPQDALDQHLAAAEGGSLPPIDATPGPGDMPRYRGIHFDGAGPEGVVFESDWKAHPPKLLWRQPCGGGFSGFAVAGNIAVTLEQRREQEVCVCYDRATGQQRWAVGWDAHFRDPTGNGPRSTPTIHEGRVYALGAEGGLVCIEAATGKKLWGPVNILEQTGSPRVKWGMTSSPLILGDEVLVNAGSGGSLAAYDARTGAPRWTAGKTRAGYSSPMTARLAGRDLVLLFDAAGLAAYDPASHERLWLHEWPAFEDMNIIQPLLAGKGRVLISSEPATGARMLRVPENGPPTVEWDSMGLSAKYANPVILGRSIFGLSVGTLVCLDLETGERLWRGRRYGHGQLLALNGMVLVLSEKGDLALVSANRAKFQELARLTVFDSRTWNTPALAGRQLFVRNDKEMACFELPARE
jgi:outer membrane protein assembly factor BamB